MKALLSIDPGGPETLVLSEIDPPQPGPGQVRLRVEACAINYPDVLIIEDRYQVKPPRPFAPGGEVAGIVDALGEGVDGWAIGDRALAVTAYGGLAEQVVVDSVRLHRLPADCRAVDGASLLLTYATVLHALADRGRLAEGETLLVLGAAGGIGLAAIEIGRLLGARVVAAVSGEDKAAAARAAGAAETVIYPRGPFDAAGLRALSGLFKQAVGEGGANVILDPVGGDYAEPALRSIAWEGRYLVLGFAAGLPSIPLNLPLLKSCDICGVFYGAHALREPEHNRAAVQRLIGWLRDGSITPRISGEFTLTDAPSAIARLAARAVVGKLVVTMSTGLE
jgi:NADPH:quinone reductase-like Zn-dependent oxidoreductase